LRNLQLVQPTARQRYANQAAGLAAHEVDRFRRYHLGRHHQIAFVFAILVIEHDDHSAGSNVGDRLVDPIERGIALGPGDDGRKNAPEPLKGAVRRLSSARPQQRNGGLRQARPARQLCRGQPGTVHCGVQPLRK
jgi:hypothetical protein